MSKARYRNIGPDKSFVPLPFIPQAGKETSKGRQGDERDKIRPLFAAVGPISRATGSALIELGHLKVVCGVWVFHSALVHPVKDDILNWDF
jgi:hypothetical protein